ncbi:MAG: hypothetical protein ACYTFA_11310 [Planctomycetota bacterium]|jgi:hypothetical protein
MKARGFCISTIVMTLMAAAAALNAQPYSVGTAFTYQGQLKQGGSPYSGTPQMIFDLYCDPAAGTLLGSVGPLGVPVAEGLFTEQLDFGADVFTGEARWLQITVKGTPLSPPQELTSAPDALALPGLWTQQEPTSPNLIGGYSVNSVTAGVSAATIGGGGDSANTSVVTGDYSTIGGGANSQAGNADGDPANAEYATVGDGSNNVASAGFTTHPVTTQTNQGERRFTERVRTSSGQVGH